MNQGQKPIKLYFFLTFLLIFTLMFAGIKIKSFLDQKYPAQPQVHETKKTSRDKLSQTFTLVDLAIGIALVLLLAFVVVKILMQKLKSRG